MPPANIQINATMVYRAMVMMELVHGWGGGTATGSGQAVSGPISDFRPTTISNWSNWDYNNLPLVVGQQPVTVSPSGWTEVSEFVGASLVSRYYYYDFFIPIPQTQVSVTGSDHGFDPQHPLYGFGIRASHSSEAFADVSFSFTTPSVNWEEPPANLPPPTGFVNLALGAPNAYRNSIHARVETSSGAFVMDALVVMNNGQGVLPQSLAPGVYTIYLKTQNSLRQRFENVVIGGSTPPTLAFANTVGDTNGDNEIGGADYAELSAHWDVTNGDEAYYYGSIGGSTGMICDFNQDGEVGGADFSIFSSNYDLVGD